MNQQNSEETLKVKEEYSDDEIIKLQQHIAELRRELKTRSKNDLIRIVIDNTLTLFALKERLKQLETLINSASTPETKEKKND